MRGCVVWQFICQPHGAALWTSSEPALWRITIYFFQLIEPFTLDICKLKSTIPEIHKSLDTPDKMSEAYPGFNFMWRYGLLPTLAVLKLSPYSRQNRVK